MATFWNATICKLESSLDAQTRTQFGAGQLVDFPVWWHFLPFFFLIFRDQLNLWLTKPLNVFSCLVDFISVSFLAAISWTNFIASSLSQLFTSNSTIISHHEDPTSQRWRRANALSSLQGRTLPKPLCLWQRHNRPKGWVLLTKVTSLGHITSSYTNLFDQASTSKSQPNISISTRPSYRISTKIRLHNLNQASTAK